MSYVRNWTFTNNFVGCAIEAREGGKWKWEAINKVTGQRLCGDTMTELSDKLYNHHLELEALQKYGRI